jgi:hypothetical protein
MAYVQWLRERSSSRWQALRRPDSSLEPEGKERSCRARLVSRAKAAGQAATNDARRCERPTCSWVRRRQEEPRRGVGVGGHDVAHREIPVAVREQGGDVDIEVDEQAR